MSNYEIPLLRSSVTYGHRLIESLDVFNESKYHKNRRANWSYRYSILFYEQESKCFRSNPKEYIEGRPKQKPKLEDVYNIRLQMKQVSIVVLKVFVHWVFYLCGRFVFRNYKSKIYRKAYVDDIESVFFPDQPSVVRALYPFPLNICRQLRYCRFLREKKYSFKTDGNPYSLRDFVSFLLKRNVRSLQRMESRAQIRHAYEVAASGVEIVQLSDEFDVGCLDFCRALRRFPLRIVNSAHGVGAYMPVHAYHEFHVLTQQQILYYKAIHYCVYSLRRLNTRQCHDIAAVTNDVSSEIRLVFLSQISSSVTKIVASNEATALRRLADEFSGSSHVKLFYRSHPNSDKPLVPAGFELLGDLNEVNGLPGTIFVSFFSTCYIDPNFQGRNVLLRGDLIFPELIYNNLDDIFDLEGLVFLVNQLSIEFSQGRAARLIPRGESAQLLAISS